MRHLISWNRNRMSQVGAVLTVLMCATAILFEARTGMAQGTPLETTTSVTDGYTPVGLSPGAPAGAYLLSGFESINPFNGSFSVHLPLVKLGGRGEVSHTIMLRIERKWRLLHYVKDYSLLPPAEQQLEVESYSVTPNWWSNTLESPYSMGWIEGRQSGKGAHLCDADHHDYEYDYTLTRLTFTVPDGTEFELRDRLTQGQPQYVALDGTCTHTFNRGKVFETWDGTAATFIADQPISDVAVIPRSENPEIDAAGNITPSGYLFLRDGTRFRIEDGNVTEKRDRNGNKITWTGQEFIDSVGRRVAVRGGGTAEQPSDLITLLDAAGGVWKTVTVHRTPLANALFPGRSIHTFHELFGAYGDGTGGVGEGEFNDPVVSSVVLPNEQAYQFLYNEYGELARVVLPSGGALEYDYAGSGCGDPTVRGLVERRVYPEGGSGDGYEKKTTYRDGWVQHFARENNQDRLIASEHHYYEGVVCPLPVQDATRYPAFTEGKEYQTEEGPDLRRVEYTWDQPAPPQWFDHEGRLMWSSRSNNPYITDTKTTLLDTGQLSLQHFEYDQYNNKKTVEEHDYGQGAPGALSRRTETTFVTSGYDSPNLDPMTADPSAVVHLRELPETQTVKDGGGNARAQTKYEYDLTAISSAGATQHDSMGTQRGNATALKRCLSTTSFNIDSCPLWLTIQNRYDDAGNVVQTTDPRGNSTTFEYTDAWGSTGAACAPAGGSAAAYVTTKRTPATPNVPGGLITQYTYDSCRGKPLTTTDPNNQVTVLEYNDLLDRLTKVTFADGGTTNYFYSDTPLFASVETRRDKDSPNDQAIRSVTKYDGLGRVIQTQLTSAPEGIVYTDTTYDGLGRKHTVSNPYRSASDDTYGITTFGYDALSRLKTTETTDRLGASTGVVTADYYGNATTVTDQAGKPRRSLTDALGRLTRVDEPNKDTGALGDVTSPVQPTYYSYDALDDLKTVTQGGQTRSFSYDSLKRLTSATNPESGTVNYTSYDGNGNLLSKTDARGIIMNYGYDALNRVTSRSYQNDPSATPAVSYMYDDLHVANSKGRLTQVNSTVSTTNYTGYDAMGRVSGSSQITNGQTYSFTYGYNLAGGITSETYPSGRTILTGYDTAGRVNGVTGSGSKTYASTLTYWPHGAVNSMTLGNNLIETTQFNSRLQPTSIGLGSLATFAYTYGMGNNNGNVLTQQIIAPGFNVTQGYCYDKLNRLTGIYEPVVPGQCQTSGWSQMYDYDQYGNRTSVQSPAYLSNPRTVVPAPAIDSATNRFQAGTDFGYDNAGNLTQAPSGASYSYDAENRLINFSNGTATYAYDGDGRRVKKAVQSANTTTVFVYNVLGQLVAEYCSGSGCTTDSGTRFLTSDHLGSTRVVTDASGGVISRHDYLPFGEAIAAGIGGRTGAMGYEDPDEINQKFTGKERDGESGLDYFGARYHGSSMGRFTSVDPVSLGKPNAALIAEPQRWNAYAYVLNDPLRNIDTDGRFSEPVHTWITTQAAQHHGYSNAATARLNAANKYVDRRSNFFNNKEHGMLDSYRTIWQGFAATEKVKNDHLGSAVEATLKGNYGAALWSLGQGTHTVEDLQAHGMIMLVEHPTSEVSIDNDGTKVSNALADTDAYLATFEANIVQAVGQEKAQQILSELKAYGQRQEEETHSPTTDEDKKPNKEQE